MSSSPETRQSLLVRIREPADAAAWRQFVTIYAPLIHAYSMRRGMQDADAADVTQRVLQSVMQAIPGFEYDPAKGSFRGWLFTITRNETRKFWQQHKSVPAATGETAFQNVLAQQEDRSGDEDLWNREHERRLFQWAVDQVRPEFRENTWQAFWEVAVEGRPAAEVAAELNMSCGAIYIAKSRVTARLRRKVEHVESC